MAWIGRALVALGAVALLLVGPHVRAGGGQGGVCYTPAPEMDAGWVAVADNCFSPTQVEVATGDVVRWSLMGQIPHTITFDEGADSGTLTSDFAVQINEPGTYRYQCMLHPGMIGSVRALGEAVGGPAIEVLDDPATVASGLQEPTSAIEDAVATRIAFSPLTAAVILLVGLPLSLGAMLRLLGIAGPSRMRLRAPWERRPVTESASR